ncbi:alanine racemase [Corynebacterium bovis]|uniref:Pyridoxal phosphate homeostasis protein n=8 Tax=Corynebacterium bovis TaxID=36808 RepID=A0A3R8PL38_9CORY|nr:alanine racemase [Corynebacterium bovis]RRO90576.1 YggS family pyridoxal phosphate enzyme [Corynebacterium bovis]RRQ00952.1 YggS family pyridoxal phosphate enzyme [Corynebacterium bovis]RRQ05002.1 YggS family pyridoxal phosphate enzyme [Corynebacterium bovis]RRQ06912.1 YggS family pyridoxal phosphate enzyme [Corynebacterium bovis]RRQ10699.1 YggS family pyridoxal phosphate enzyme [Corynebacterium bovis]
MTAPTAPGAADAARRAELAAALDRVRARIAAAGGADLLPVTKFHPAGDLALLADLGVRAVGENREQEARAKHDSLGGVPALQMIGQVQTKKANAVARWAAAVHTVDSARLVAALDRGVALALERGDRAPADDRLPVLLQWSADGDAARGGAVAGDLDALADAVAATRHLSLRGLMCVPPRGVEPGPVFARGRRLLDAVADRIDGDPVYSAGMSGDLEAAVAEGSTLVRVGTDIMGPRPVA